LRSPSLRCEQTLQVMVRVLGLTTPEIVVSEFAETDYGDFEGMTAEEIKMRHPNVVETWLRRSCATSYPLKHNRQCLEWSKFTRLLRGAYEDPPSPFGLLE